MVVEGTLARPDNHAEERPNRAAADPPRVNPALCTCEDAARHLRPVRGPHGGNQHHPCAVARAKVSKSPYERARAPHKGPNRAARASCTAVLRKCVVVPSTWVTSVPRRPQVVPMGLLYTGATAARWPRPRQTSQTSQTNKSNKRIKQIKQTIVQNPVKSAVTVHCNFTSRILCPNYVLALSE